jgi:hypothetical protein
VPVSQDADPERRFYPAAHSRTDSAGARWPVPAAPFHALSEGIKGLQATINPLVGSNVSSPFAAAFKPFAIVAAQHGYSVQPQSATRRSEFARHVHLLDTLKRQMLVHTVDQIAAKGARTTDLLPGISDANRGSPDALSARILKLRLALRPALEGFRVLLSRSWSPDTVHRETILPTRWSAGNPQGQCGVTSAWLAEILAREYSVSSRFCRGFLIFGQHKAENVLDHCWLEIDGAHGEEIVIDLTCDQARGFDRQIVFDAKADLKLQQINYITRDRLKVSDLDRTPVWPRYCSLRRSSERVKTPGELRVEASQHLIRCKYIEFLC